MIRFLTIFLLISTIGNAQLLLEPVTLSPEKEAWLIGDVDSALQLIGAMEPGEQDAAVHNYNLGYLHFVKENYVTALDYFQKSLASQDPSPYTYLYMSRIYQINGFLSAAYQQIQNALDMDSNNLDFILELAHLSEATDRLTDAVALYKHILEKDDKKTAAIIGLGNLYTKQGNYKQAQKILKPDESIYPESGLLLARAGLHDALGEKQKAAELITQLCRAYPNAPETQKYIDTLAIKYDITDPDLNDPGIQYNFNFIENEEINYKVSYGFITLGWVNVRVAEPVIIDGKKVYPVRFFLNSNPDFSMMISLHHLYESYIDSQTFNAIRTRVYTPGDEEYLAKMYHFDYDNNRFKAQIITSDGRFEILEKLLPSKAQDGVSMLYFARGLVSSKASGSTTVVIDEEYKYGHINFLNETEEIEINDQDIDAIKIFARADFQGVAGMNGDAWGWFSGSPDFVPLEGKIRIILGSITLSLDNETPMN